MTTSKPDQSAHDRARAAESASISTARHGAVTGDPYAGRPNPTGPTTTTGATATARVTTIIGGVKRDENGTVIEHTDDR
jgi:hypothetical protein